MSVNNKNFQSPLNFELRINKLITTNFNLTRVNLPGLNLAPVSVPTNVNKHFVAGDEIEYETLDIDFKVQEGLEGWYEIFQWMVSLGFPESHTQYSDIVKENLRDLRGNHRSQLIMNAALPSGSQNLYSDIILTILTSKLNPYLKIQFNNAFPIGLSNLTFNTSDNSVEYLTASARFKFDTYNISVDF